MSSFNQSPNFRLAPTMVPHRAQYHHYIPRFILKQFAHAEAVTERPTLEGHLHVFDLPSRQFSLGEVRKTCGGQNLYYNTEDTNPMRIENLFSKLESKTSTIFRRISTAVTEGRDHIDILEKDVHLLFKFMYLSLQRSEHFRDEVDNPYRENDFVFQQMFEDRRKRGQSGNPAQFWLESLLLYLLETSHEHLLADAEKTDVTSSADTYKHFTERYALQIWRAADGHEFFLNETLVDFEGDTTSFLGMQEKETGPQLIRMPAAYTDDHSRCWESPFTDAMHRAKIPSLANSLLKDAPHKDIVKVNIPSERRGKKRWPATVAWRVSIGTLSRQHHRIIASYSLDQCAVIPCSSKPGAIRASHERTGRVSAGKSGDVEEAGNPDWPSRRPAISSDGPSCRSSQELMERMVDRHTSALRDISNLVATSRERIPKNKEHSFKCWRAILTLHWAFGAGLTLSSESDGTSSKKRIMHPALKMAFEAAYPPKPPDHRDLIEVDFAEFLYSCVGEEVFAKLSDAIHMKIQELVQKDCFGADSDAAVQKLEADRGFQAAATALSQQADFAGEGGEDVLNNPCFQSIFAAAEEFDVLWWMFEERQDILATFVRQMAVPMAEMQPSVVRIRARRE
ncbi:hypothetical protein GE09DRAFT_1283147 [Coniochaeta sp. 2T2.1]|nr:hypothetical protein GE09DRAFT_1283147 [Coniochaeta sp. 2T2.1]